MQPLVLSLFRNDNQQQTVHMATTNESSLVDRWTSFLWNGAREDEQEGQPSSLPELFPELDQLLSSVTTDKYHPSNLQLLNEAAPPMAPSPMVPSPTVSSTSSGNSSIADLFPTMQPMYPAAISNPTSISTWKAPIPRSNRSPLAPPVPELLTKAEMRKRKNREAAWISREKKRQEVSRQEEQLQQLREENERLKQQLEAALKENQRLKSMADDMAAPSSNILLHRKRVRLDVSPPGSFATKQSVTTLAAVLFSALLLVIPSWLPMNSSMGGGLLESGYGASGYSSSQPQSLGGRVLFARLPDVTTSNVSPLSTRELVVAHPTLPSRASIASTVPELSRIPKSIGVVGSSTDAAQWLTAATELKNGGGVEKSAVEHETTKALSLYCAGELVPLLPMPSLSPWMTTSQSKRQEQHQQRPIRVQLLAPLQAEWSSSFSGDKILQQNESDRGAAESGRMFLKMDVQVLRANIISS